MQRNLLLQVAAAVARINHRQGPLYVLTFIHVGRKGRTMVLAILKLKDTCTLTNISSLWGKIIMKGKS